MGFGTDVTGNGVLEEYGVKIYTQRSIGGIIGLRRRADAGNGQGLAKKGVIHNQIVNDERTAQKRGQKAGIISDDFRN